MFNLDEIDGAKTKADKVAETPLMRQYYEFKRKYPDAILLFRIGDFYETFGDDAVIMSETLGITLTKRANGAAASVPLAGFPYHAIDNYLPKLVRAGKKIAICDQLEDPKLAKTIVKRGITELVTPGVVMSDRVLEMKENNFLACISRGNKGDIGIAFLDISTGEFLLAEGDESYIEKLLGTFAPKEVLLSKADKNWFLTQFGDKHFLSGLEEWTFHYETNREKLLKLFKVSHLKGFGVESLLLGITAAGAIVQYLDMTQHENVAHINKIVRIEEQNYVWIDKFSLRNLEILTSMSEGGRALVDILDKTTTAMGGRLLRRWLALPLKDIDRIRERHQVVQFFVNELDITDALREKLRIIGDIERLCARCATARITPREVWTLRNSISAIPSILKIVKNSDNPALKNIVAGLSSCSELTSKINKTLVPEPPVAIGKGDVITGGVSEELDELRKIKLSSNQYLNQLQDQECRRTQIPSLKISFNNVFGYYIEVRNTHRDKVPANWIRKQTLTQAERYITPELKELEAKILNAEGKILQLETEIFQRLVGEIMEFIPAVQKNAQVLSALDCLQSFAETATTRNYCMPEIYDGDQIDIKDGRHPVIEAMLPPEKPFVANDIYLDNSTQQIIVLTGPNMSGKSALLRQTALIVLLAQIGSFVPARAAKIGYVDKIFTRVGASDNLSLGESTFMVEMTEAASIMNNLTDRSLILLDEIGRGTSTYDGISIAWAMAEFIHENDKARAKTLFATHYHELSEMEKDFPRIKNFNIAVRELSGNILFLRKLVEGSSEHSFGIHVAQMAGMPIRIVKRAEQILEDLESSARKSNSKIEISPAKEIQEKLSENDILLNNLKAEIQNLNINNLTPMQAFEKIQALQQMISK